MIKINTLKNIFIQIAVVSLVFGCSNLTAVKTTAVKSTDLANDPVLTADGRLQKDGYYEKVVYYGTSRVDSCKKQFAQVPLATLRLDYQLCLKSPFRLDTGNNEGEKVISYGQVKVKIPYLKEVGGTSGMTISALNHDIGWDKFISNLSNKDLVVFVHGFNTSFSNAAIRCAQLAHDTNFKGEAVFFSWPSDENPLTYATDKKRATENFMLLADFLQNLSLKTNKKIHIVAHSMGTYILMNSLTILNDRMIRDSNLLEARKNQNGGKVFSQIILAAPDIAKEEYRENFSKSHFAKMAENITLYSAVNDKVLGVSRAFNSVIEGTAEARLGDSSKEFFVIKGMDTVDTRQEIKPQFFGHSFYAEYRSLVTDIHEILNSEKGPDDRLLQKVGDLKGNTLWFIRD